MKRRFLFFRFMLAFGVVISLFVTALIIILSLVFQPLRDLLPRPEMFFFIICGVPLAFAALASLFGGLVFRRFTTPLADVMAAADAVAEGDFTVRLREEIPGEFGRLSRSFNRMTAELDRSEQQRRHLTADVAHELRTPLHIIQGNLEGVLDGVYKPTPEHISATLEETRLLSRLVDDLQTLSLAEAGQLPLHKELVQVGDLVNDVATSFTHQAAESRVELRVEISESLAGFELNIDLDRMDQVLSNLLANALRHTPTGGQVTLSAQSLPEGIRFVVQDTGEGISAQDLPFIFDRFWKGDRSRAHSQGSGSGLGLAIARQLVQAHGGTINAESQPGVGTKFLIDLPING
jgi:two-component system OmpR family sensor kinase/two-component system sensor histidine kinase BaeS